ncbi:MAG: 1-acyl-sn-glycerol-3-phosphate acyltransferase, partial [Kangiellaceae bacterium]
MKQSRLPNSQSNISLISLLPNRMQDNWLYKTLAIIGDRLFGISKLRDTYEKIGLSGLDKQDFCSKLLQELNIQIEGENTLLDCVPKTGGMIIVCNHPHGMLDGIIIAKLLTSQRKDTKILANIGLKMIKEIREYFIFSNPLKANVPINIKAIKQCIAHVKQGGLLVIFPAGRVSFYHKENQKIADGEWNRITINIATKTKAPILPVHVSGKNSNWFYRIG